MLENRGRTPLLSEDRDSPDPRHHLLRLRCRAHIAAAFAQRSYVPHPWLASDWYQIREALTVAYSLYCQMAADASSAKRSIPRSCSLELSVQYTRGGGEPSVALEALPTRSAVLQWAVPCGGLDDLVVEFAAYFDDKAATAEFTRFLQDELNHQLALDPFPESLCPRHDIASRLAATLEDRLWDLRFRFSDFLRRFLGAFGDTPEAVDALGPFSTFFVRSRTQARDIPLSSGHARSGLFRHVYEIDGGHKQYLEKHHPLLDADVLRTGALVFPDGLCAKVFLFGRSYDPDETADITSQYSKESLTLKQFEDVVLEQTTLLEVPIYQDLPQFSGAARVDGPELILCAALKQPPDLQRSTEEPKAKPWAPLLNAPVDSSFQWGEAQLVTEMAQRLTARYLTVLPAPSMKEVLVAETASTKEALRIAKRLAGTSEPVLVTGPTGTGKTALARYIHQLSGRSDMPLGTFFCGPDTLVEADLFGHTRGAFTGATEPKRGLLEVLHGGTLLINEVDRLSLDVQGKLLEYVEDHRFRPLGSQKVLETDVRILATINIPPTTLVREGRFREDLLYRLNTFVITLYPLAERPEDLAVLLRDMVTKYSRKYRRQFVLSETARQLLLAHSWPGGIRELDNVIRRIALLAPSHEVGEVEVKACFGNGDWQHAHSASRPEWLTVIPGETLEAKCRHLRGFLDGIAHANA